MLKHEQTQDEWELRRLTSAEGEFLAVATFSPGPWFGFNGIQTLALTSDRLFIVQRGIAPTAGRVQSFPVSQLSSVVWGVRRGGRTVSLRFRGADRPRWMTSKYEEALRLAKTLDGLVITPSRDSPAPP